VYLLAIKGIGGKSSPFRAVGVICGDGIDLLGIFLVESNELPTGLLERLNMARDDGCADV
jgi:hypothetical protein